VNSKQYCRKFSAAPKFQLDLQLKKKFRKAIYALFESLTKLSRRKTSHHLILRKFDKKCNHRIRIKNYRIKNHRIENLLLFKFILLTPMLRRGEKFENKEPGFPSDKSQAEKNTNINNMMPPIRDRDRLIYRPTDIIGRYIWPFKYRPLYEFPSIFYRYLVSFSTAHFVAY